MPNEEEPLQSQVAGKATEKRGQLRYIVIAGQRLTPAVPGQVRGIDGIFLGEFADIVPPGAGISSAAMNHYQGFSPAGFIVTDIKPVNFYRFALYLFHIFNLNRIPAGRVIRFYLIFDVIQLRLISYSEPNKKVTKKLPSLYITIEGSLRVPQSPFNCNTRLSQTVNGSIPYFRWMLSRIFVYSYIYYIIGGMLR